MRCAYRLLELGQLVRNRALEARNSLRELCSNGCVDPGFELGRKLACRLLAELVEVLSQLRPQAGVLAACIRLERFVDDLRKGSAGSPFQQVAGLHARGGQLRDPPLEHLCPDAELLEWQLDRTRFEPRRLGDFYRCAMGEVGG